MTLQSQAPSLTGATRRAVGYSALQIGLHWLIAALVVFQLLFGESMEEAIERAERAGTAPSLAELFAQPHYWVGIAVLVLAVVRLALRLRHGAPPSPAGAPAWTVIVARATHAAFYLLLFALPISGVLAAHVSEDFGDPHVAGKPVFVVLILLHVAGGLFHQFALKDGTLRRMMVPRGAR